MHLWRILIFWKPLLDLFVLTSGQAPISSPPPLYQFRQFLDDDQNFELYWSIINDKIQFEVNVRTTGYVGFGLSESNTGKMSPADMVIGWVQEENVYFGDYHTVGVDSRTPIYDPSQDWTLRSRPGLQFAKEENGYTNIAFERKLETCDDNDLSITDDTMMVIYSYSDVDPNVTTGIFPHHGNNRRGSSFIFFKSQLPVPELFPPTGSYRLPLKIQNYEIPTQIYTRQCLVYDVMDAVTPNSYLIMFEPDVQAGNEAFVYRMILYRCNITNPVLLNNRFDCTDGGPGAIKACTNVIATWSMGGEPFFFPDNMGILQGPNDPHIYVLQIHYTNGQGAAGIIDNSGLNVMFTSTPRPIDVAFLSLGSVISTNLRQVIPPGEERFKTSAFCSQRCLQWGFNGNVSSTIQAIGVIFHGNDIAREMKLRHFRNNVELPWISSDKSYDSFYQAVRLFPQPVIIQNETDTISLDCIYDSSERTALTKGGWSQVEELCRATLIYYPPLPMDQCLSWSSLDRLTSATGQTIPENNTMQYLDSVDPWDLAAKTRLKNALDMSTQKALCSSMKQTPNYALDHFQNPFVQDIMEYQGPGTGCPTSTV